MLLSKLINYTLTNSLSNYGLHKKQFFIFKNSIIKLLNKSKILNSFIYFIIEEIKIKKHKVKLFKNNKINYIADFNFNNKIITISYILKFIIYKKSIMLHLTNNKGITLFYLNSGLLKILTNKKINKHNVLKALSTILENINFSKHNNIALHFNSNIKQFNKIIIKFIKPNYKINIIKLFNLTPHNGCRPKKIKRLKRFSISNIKFNEEMTEWLKVIDCKSIGTLLT